MGNSGDDSVINKGFKFHKEQWETVEAALEQMKSELPTDFDNVAMEHIAAVYLAGPQGEVQKNRVSAAFGEGPASVEEAGATLQLVYEWLKENTDSPFEACGPVVDMFEAVFSEGEAVMRLKANG